MKFNPAYLPDTVAFKRIMRDLIRKNEYVPPFQERTQPSPFASSSPQRTAETALPEEGVRVGTWVLHTDEVGNLVARHDDGAVRIVALLIEEHSG